MNEKEFIEILEKTKKPNLESIQQTYAIIAIGPDGNEGIPSCYLPGTNVLVPMVCTTEKNMNLMVEHLLKGMKEQSQGNAVKFEVVKFTNREHIKWL